MIGHIVIAPFSNSDIRDWPATHYRALIDGLLDAWSGTIHVVGAPGQAIRAREITRSFDATRVFCDGGRLSWPEVVALIRSAACVIGNNSGIPHLAAFEGVPTVCVFGGAHQRLEWRPLGGHVVTLSRAIACSPCHLHYAAACPYGLACLEQIRPETVLDTVLRMIDHLPAETFADTA
ncbi:MAG: glycosyltransferase family 9 protein [Achromobacter sp.]